MKELEIYIEKITRLSKFDYHQLIKTYPKELVDQHLDNKLLKELSTSQNTEDKITLWNNYGYYLSTKEHSIYEKFELSTLKPEEEQNKNYLSRQEELIYGLHLLSKRYLTIVKEKDNEITLDIQKIFTSIKTKETRDYVLNKLTYHLNNTSLNSNYNKSVLGFIEKYITLCNAEVIPSLANLFKNKTETIDEYELKEQIDMYIRYCNAKEIFLHKNLDLVEYTVSNCYKEDKYYEDTLQDGRLALIKAVNNFDVRMKNKFSTYAVPTIIRHITRERPKCSYCITLSYDLYELKRKISQALIILTNEKKRYPTKKELANYLKISETSLNKRLYLFHLTDCSSIDEVIDAEELASFTVSDTIIDENINFEQEICAKDETEKIFKCIEETLTKDEIDILFKMSGINTEKVMTLSEIGKTKNITREAVRKRKLKALQKLNNNPNLKITNPFIN